MKSLVLREVVGRPLEFFEGDGNVNRLMYYSGNWDIATAYTLQEVVRHNGGTWICILDAAAGVEPGPANRTTWEPLCGFPGRGAMEMSTPTAGADIGIGWNVLDYFDAVSLQPYGVTLDTTNGLWRLDFTGLWQQVIALQFSHNNSNSGRTTNLRIWNVTEASEVGRVAIGVARNVEDTMANLTALFDITSVQVNDVLRLEIGGGDTITTVQYNDMRVSSVQLGVV